MIRLTVMTAGGCAAMALLMSPVQTAVAGGETRSLKMFHLHTKETIDIVYKRNGQYDQEALKKIDWFLRDWREQKSTRMDPKLLDTISTVYRELGATQPVQIVCGYRAPSTNNMLRRRGRGVAKNSQHTLGKAIDFFIPGVDLSALRVAGLRQQRGGVGFYPSSGSPFVHLDVGSVRMWPRMTREQLANVFPDGRTVYLPADGKPMPRYQEAYAALRRNGNISSGFARFSTDDEDSEASAESSAPILASLPKASAPGGPIAMPSPRPPELGAPVALAWQEAPAPLAQDPATLAAKPALYVKPGGAVLASADPSAPILTRRLTLSAPSTKPALAPAAAPAALPSSKRDKPVLISTRFENLNFAALSTPISAARNKTQAQFVRPDLNSIGGLIQSPSRVVLTKFGLTAYQDLRMAQFTGVAIKPLRVANLSGPDPIATGALASR